MVQLKFSFLIAFDTSVAKETGVKRNKKPPKEKKKKGNKKDKKKHGKNKGEEDNPAPLPPPPPPPYVIKVEKPIGWANIEYEFLPKRPKQRVDIICWGSIAKIFSANGDFIIKCIVFDDCAWVPVTIYHTIPQLEDEEMSKLPLYTLKFLVQTSKNKLGKMAKKENTQVFYVKENEFCIEDKFLKAYDKDPNVKEEFFEKKHLKGVDSNKFKEHKENHAENNENLDSNMTKTAVLEDTLHSFKIYKILDDLKLGKIMNLNKIPPSCQSNVDGEGVECVNGEDNIRVLFKAVKTKGKKGGKEKKKKEKKAKKAKKQNKKNVKKRPINVEVIVPAEIFFTEPSFSLFKGENEAPGIKQVYVLSSVRDLMTESQIIHFNPFVFKIHKIINLPADILHENNFSSVYVSVNIPSVFQCKTNPMIPIETLKINESHVQFLKNPTPFEFNNLVKTERLYVELRGIKDSKDRKEKNVLFGSVANDYHISERSKLPTLPSDLRGAQQSPEDLLLAVACYDISSLNQPPYYVKTTENLHNPLNLTCAKNCAIYENFDFQDVLTVNELNLKEIKCKDCSDVLNEGTLCERETKIKISLRCYERQHLNLEILNSENLYRRLLIEMYDRKIAAEFLNEIINNNVFVIGEETMPFNYLKATMKSYYIENDDNQSNSIDEEKEKPKSNDIISGFLLDNCSSSLFFLEGSQNGYINQIWQYVMNFSSRKCRVMFHSKNLYEKRIYSEFISYGGIYVITLKQSLQHIMNHPLIYVSGNVPIPCWKALNKLNLLIRSQSFMSANQFALFPTAKQLLSLDIEMGVAFAHEKKRRSIINLFTSVF